MVRGQGGRERTSVLRRPQAPAESAGQSPSSGSPGSWPRSSSSTPSRPCTRRTSPKGLQNACFFFVPFSLVFALLRDVEWDRRLLVGVLWVIGLEAVVFVAIGTVEYATRSLFWNDQVIRSNEFHTYFRVNSVFWDPNVYGRWLALAIVVAMAALLWARERRAQALLTALVAVLWIGLAPTFSQSSFIALLAGLAMLAALRWSLRWTLAAVGGGSRRGGSRRPSRRRLLGERLADQHRHLRPRQPRLRRHPPLRPAPGLRLRLGLLPARLPRTHRHRQAPRSRSPTPSRSPSPPSRGSSGSRHMRALLVTALWTMGGGGLVRFRPAGPRPRRPPERRGRAAVLAAFIALLVHTMAYAGFYEDPIAWVLMAAGLSLAAAPVRDGP